MTEKKGSLIPGILFIVIGLWLLSRSFYCFRPHWFRVYPVLVLLFAIFLLIEALRRRHSGTLFWGTVVLLVGVFFALRNFGVIPYFYNDEYWPVVVIIVGLAMFVGGLVRQSGK